MKELFFNGSHKSYNDFVKRHSGARRFVARNEMAVAAIEREIYRALKGIWRRDNCWAKQLKHAEEHKDWRKLAEILAAVARNAEIKRGRECNSEAVDPYGDEFIERLDAERFCEGVRQCQATTAAELVTSGVCGVKLENGFKQMVLL